MTVEATRSSSSKMPVKCSSTRPSRSSLSVARTPPPPSTIASNYSQNKHSVLSLSLRFTDHFPGEPGLKQMMMEVVSGDSWSYKSRKAPVKSSPPTNQDPVFLQARYPSCHPTNSVKALKGKYHIPWTCLPQAHLGVFQLCL